MPEWSNGAVSKTVDQLAGPRVRIPFSPQRRSRIIPILLLLFLPLHIPSFPPVLFCIFFSDSIFFAKPYHFEKKIAVPFADSKNILYLCTQSQFNKCCQQGCICDLNSAGFYNSNIYLANPN